MPAFSRQQREHKLHVQRPEVVGWNPTLCYSTSWRALLYVSCKGVTSRGHRDSTEQRHCIDDDALPLPSVTLEQSFACCIQIFSACLLATTYGNHTFAGLRSIQIRILAPSHLLSDSLEREIARVVYTRVRNSCS